MDYLGSHKVAGVRDAIEAFSRTIDTDVLDRLRLIEEQPLTCLHAVTSLSVLLHL
jgi:hypothetical protein